MKTNRYLGLAFFAGAAVFLLLALFGGFENHGTYVLVSKHCERFQILYACLSAVSLIGLSAVSVITRRKKGDQVQQQAGPRRR